MLQGVCYNLTKFISWLLFRFKFGLEVQGQRHVPREGPFILASNHVSFLDPLVLGVSCPRRLRFMARSDLFRHFALGIFLRAVGVISLRRSEQDVTAIRTAVQWLKRGQPIALFPEGTRQLSGKLGSAKRGVGLLAALAKVPIVPVVVAGTFKALPPHSKTLHPAKIRVAFGEKILYTISPFLEQDTSQAASERDSSRSLQDRRARASGVHQQLADTLTQRWRQLAMDLNGE